MAREDYYGSIRGMKVKGTLNNMDFNTTLFYTGIPLRPTENKEVL
jgi:hypothetical protein